ncbi:4450_t:CDS:2, partial [Paraglomus brasilianum]
MSTTVFNKILDFMKDGPVKHITAGSVIYKGTEEDQTISKDELLKLTINAIRSMKNIADKCHEFVSGFSEEYIEDLCIKLTHNGKWKESDETFMEVTQDILDVVADVWMNPAFGPELMKTQSEGTYVTDVIIPSIWASLKGLPYSAERQSIASADRKGDGYFGKRPDFMYLQKREGKIFELVFGECSRLLCSDTKKREDGIKLWRETND